MPEPNDPSKTSPQESGLYKRMQQMQEELAALRKQNEKQQELLFSREFLQGRQEPKEEEYDLNSPQDLFNALTKVIAEEVENRVANFSNELVPLLKEATGESTVWQKKNMVAEIMEKNPGISTELALELATARMEKKTADDARLAEETQQAEAEERALQASLGYRNNSSSSAPDTSRPKTLHEIFNKNWDALDMDAATQRYNEDIVDDWGPAPEGPAVRPMS